MTNGYPYLALKCGCVVDGYRIENVIGTDGLGITYKAEYPALKKTVAIKEYIPADFVFRLEGTKIVPKSEKDQDDYNWGLERFLDEARLLANYDHQNIVNVHRFFKAHGTAYIVMEYVDGETLSPSLRLIKHSHTLS